MQWFVKRKVNAFTFAFTREFCRRTIEGHSKGKQLWLALAHQAISSGQEARIIASLQTLITLYNSLADLSDPLREEIDVALQSVLKRVAQKNQELSG